MAWKQLRSFNQGTAGNVHLACLSNTRKGFGINAKYQSAWQAWSNTDQHTDPIPTGVDVPLYFWYKDANNGHVGVRLANGQFWSDGVTYASLAAFQSGHTPQYRGWSTSINGVAVIQQVADAPAPVPHASGMLHLDRGTDTTTFNAAGGKVGNIHAADDSYNYTVLSNQGNKVEIHSASGGGDVWVYLRYSANNQPIPGRRIV